MWGNVLHEVSSSASKRNILFVFSTGILRRIRFRMNRVFVYYFLEKRCGSPTIVSQDTLVPFRSLFRVMMMFGRGDVRNRDASGLCRHRKMPIKLESAIQLFLNGILGLTLIRL